MLPSVVGSNTGMSGGGSGGGSPEPRFIKNFTPSNFSGGTITVSEAAHDKGTSPKVQLFELQESVYVENTNNALCYVDIQGNVTVRVDVGAEFEGKLIIS